MSAIGAGGGAASKRRPFAVPPRAPSVRTTRSASSPPAAIVDTYGAGDSFGAALTFALGRGDELEVALAFAARAGAAVITGKGPYTAQLDARRD